MNQTKNRALIKTSLKQRLISACGWSCLCVGIFLTIVPVFYERLGHQSGLVAFGILFIGISLLKVRKDQIEKQANHLYKTKSPKSKSLKTKE